MKLQFIKSSLKLLAIIGLMSLGIFAQNNWRNDLSEQRWDLTEINGKRIYNSKAFLMIAESNDRFSGNAGCNRMFGEVSISGRNIDFGAVGTTKMFCNENGAMKLETDFARTLEKVTRFEKTGNTLNLYVRNRLVLKLKAAKTPDSDNSSSIKLEDKKWVLESIKDDALPNYSTAYINFDKKTGETNGNSSCNSFGGNYTASAGNIGFKKIRMTLRACIEDDKATIEKDFVDNLLKANRYEIVKGKLNLYANKTLLLTFRAEAK